MIKDREYRMGKKGTWFLIPMIIIFVVFLTFSMLTITGNHKEILGEKTFIGKQQLELIGMYSDAELDMLFYDTLSDLILNNALYKLGLMGGFYVESECGVQGGYQLWYSKERECPPPYKKNLGSWLDDEYETYRSVFPEEYRDQDIDSFVFSVYDGEGRTFVDAISLKDIILKQGTDSDTTMQYSVKPSFTMESGYDTSVYSVLQRESAELRESCMNKRDYSSCVRDRLVHMGTEFSDMVWDGDCNTGVEKLFYHFVESYENCMNSIDEGCQCEIDFDFGKDENKEAGLRGEYFIELSKDGTVRLEDPDTGEAYEHVLETSPTKYSAPKEVYEEEIYGEYDSLRIGISYNRFGNFKGSRILLEEDVDFSDGDEMDPVKLYKVGGTDYEYEKEMVFYDVEGAEMCGTFSRVAKVCVKSIKEFDVYKDSAAKKTHMPVKFGIYFNDIFPPVFVENIKVEDLKKAEGAVVLTFDKNKVDEDIYQYRVYYSENDFANVEAAENYANLSHDKISEGDEVIVNGLEDGKVYHFSVTGVDVFGNEDKVVDTVQGMPIDDLAPGLVRFSSPEATRSHTMEIAVAEDQDSLSVSWEEPTVNENNQPLVDLFGYFIFIDREVPVGWSVSDCIFPFCYFVPAGKMMAVLEPIEEGQHTLKIVAVDDEIPPNYKVFETEDSGVVDESGEVPIKPGTETIIEGAVADSIAISQPVYGRDEIGSRAGPPGDSNLVTVQFLGRNVRVNTIAADAFRNVHNEFLATGISYNVWREPGGGTYNFRKMRGSDRYSSHAYGLAIDINPGSNPYYKRQPGMPCKTDIPAELVASFKRNGFCWGGHFTRVCDAMHFEYCGR